MGGLSDVESLLSRNPQKGNRTYKSSIQGSSIERHYVGVKTTHSCCPQLVPSKCRMANWLGSPACTYRDQDQEKSSPTVRMIKVKDSQKQLVLTKSDEELKLKLLNRRYEINKISTTVTFLKSIPYQTFLGKVYSYQILNQPWGSAWI